MKILIVHPSFYIYGGGELAIVKLCEHLVKNNEVSILTSTLIPYIEKDLHKITLFRSSEFNVQTMTRWIAKHGNYDVINFHNHPAEVLSEQSKSFNVWNHNEPPEYVLHGGTLRKEEYDVVQDHMNRVIVADTFNQNRVNQLYGKKSIIIPYGTDPSFWNPSNVDTETSKALGILGSDFVLLHPGWFSPFKNQMRTAILLDNLRNKIPSLKVVFCGPPSQVSQEIFSFLQSKNLLHRVNFIYTDREHLRDLYGRANVVFLPYRSQGGFLSVLDSLCMSRPVIISPEIPCIDLLKENNLGIITTDFEEEILKIYKEGFKVPERWREYVNSNLTWDIWASKCELVFMEGTK